MPFAPLKTLTALTLSATLATSAVADTRSYAHTHGGQNHNVPNGNQVAGGLLALLLLGIAIDQIDDNDRGRAEVRITPNGGGHADNERRAARRALPGQCVRQGETRNGVRRVMLSRCLERNYRFVSRLPRQCLTQVRTNRGWRDAYGARCLRRDGFTIQR